MKLYGKKAREVADDILEAFRTGAVPKALATVFLFRGQEFPAAKWSFTNRMLVALGGHADARGYRQWQAVGRQVKKGSRASYIFVPCHVKAKEDDEEREIRAGDPVLVGFKAVPVFGYAQTEGDPLPGDLTPAQIDALPLVEVARSWDLEVTTAPPDGPTQGIYQHGQRIVLSVENLATWSHELLHAADDRLGTLTKAPGQQLDNEVVAELGGAVLLECLGYETESDRGGAFAYIESYCKKHERNVMGVCLELLERTCACVSWILETADELAAAPARTGTEG